MWCEGCLESDCVNNRQLAVIVKCHGVVLMSCFCLTQCSDAPNLAMLSILSISR